MRIGEGRERFDARTVAHWDQVTQALGRVVVIYAIPEERRPPYGMLDITSFFVLAYHVRDYLIQLEGRTDAKRHVDTLFAPFRFEWGNRTGQMGGGASSMGRQMGHHRSAILHPRGSADQWLVNGDSVFAAAAPCGALAVDKVGMKWDAPISAVDHRGPVLRRGVSMRKVLPYWSTMADDLDVWHDQGDCPEGAKIPPGRLLQAAAPPSARRHCTVCLFLDKAT